MIRAVIFDYDGVIVDSFPEIYEIYKTICRELGVTCPTSFESFKQLYGYSYKELLKNIGVTNDEGIKQAQEIFAREITTRDPALYSGIAQVIAELHKNYRLFLITANMRDEALQKLRKYNLESYFTHVGGVDKTQGKYGKRTEITSLLEREKLKPHEVVYIGDRNIDYDVARDVNILHIMLVDYGWGFDREHATNIQTMDVRKPTDILEAMKEFDGK